MGKSRYLQDVAAGLLGTFIGRHNDIDGYWALGMLRADHPGIGGGETTLSLLECRAAPATPSTDLTLHKFVARLRGMLAHHGFAPHDVSAAKIVIAFDAAIVVCKSSSSSFGDPFRCTVTLANHRGKIYIATEVGRCAVHNPADERKSTRAHQPEDSSPRR